MIGFNGLVSNSKKSLLLILTVSCIVKISLLLMTDVINDDAVRYINSARELFLGDIKKAFEHEKMLGFSLLLGLMQLVVSDWFLAGKLLSFFALVFATIPVYLIARDLFGARAALAAGLMFSVAPLLNEYMTKILKGPLFILCITISLWLVLRERQRGFWRFLLAGLFSLLATMFRVEGVVYIGIVITLLGALALMSSGNRRLELRNLVSFAFLPAVVLLLTGIVTLSGVISQDHLVLVQQRFQHYFRLNFFDSYKAIYQYLKAAEPQFSGGRWSNDFFELARHQMLLIYMIGLLQEFSKAIFPVFLLPLGFGVFVKERWGRQKSLLVCVILGFLLMAYFFLVENNFTSSRYMMIPIVLSLILSGYGMDRMLNFLSSIKYKKLAYLLVFILFIVAPVTKSFSDCADEEKEVRAAGEWLKENRHLEKSLLMTNDERIAYHAGLMRNSYKVFSSAEPLGYEAFALQEGCDLFVLELTKGRQEKPYSFEQFELLREFSGNRRIILVYERMR